MFEKILSSVAINEVESLSLHLGEFYLAGGTGLALQIGHRKSEDLDFFTDSLFNTDALLSVIHPDKVLFTSKGTIHCEVKGLQLSFIYYEVPLIYPPLIWRGIKLAQSKDIVAEKIKTLSQRGSKKDFIDLYALLKLKYSVKEVSDFFKKRFKGTGINLYHVVKSLVFFEDADQEPSPVMIKNGDEWQWDNIKSYFLDSIDLFEKEFGLN